MYPEDQEAVVAGEEGVEETLPLKTITFTKYLFLIHSIIKTKKSNNLQRTKQKWKNLILNMTCSARQNTLIL